MLRISATVAEIHVLRWQVSADTALALFGNLVADHFPVPRHDGLGGAHLKERPLSLYAYLELCHYPMPFPGSIKPERMARCCGLWSPTEIWS